MHKIRQPTTTSLVLEQLRARPNDFMSVRMLADIIGRKRKDVGAALFSLRQYGAVDVVVNVSGIGWWFATGEDHRRWEARGIVPDIHRNRKKPL